MTSPDPYDLHRFVEIQEREYPRALLELTRGRKTSHWIWFIFPQIAGLGRSSLSQRFAISSRAEARAYQAHPVLGPRLRDCCQALLAHRDRRIDQILDAPDDLKVRSSMTLFAEIDTHEIVFQEVIDAFFEGKRDRLTQEILEEESR
ncbi:MAG: DUF1810 domain-containing protein [Verrucomicrobiota bacterium]